MATQIRLPADLHEELKEIADLEARSLNAQMIYLLRHAARQYRQQHGPDSRTALAEHMGTDPGTPLDLPE